MKMEKVWALHAVNPPKTERAALPHRDVAGHRIVLLKRTGLSRR